MFSFLNRKSVRPVKTVRGLYYPPEAGQSWSSHREWAGAQRPTPEGFMALSLVTLNPTIHRCRIGKITLKQAS